MPLPNTGTLTTYGWNATGIIGGLPHPSATLDGLADVLEILLDRGLVIDAYVRVSLVGIELLTVDLRVVIASVDTYLRFAEAVNRLDLRAVDNSVSIANFGEEKEEVAGSAGRGAVEGGPVDRGDQGKGWHRLSPQRQQ